MPDGWTRDGANTWRGPDKKGVAQEVEAKYHDSLENLLGDALEALNAKQTVVVVMEDMESINEHFQAVLDWMKARGNASKHRYGPGCFLERGVLYFVPHDVHHVAGPTRGADLELDLREDEEHLIREIGLEARLRAKGML